MVFFQAEDGIRDIGVTGVQTCALPISPGRQPDLRVDEPRDHDPVRDEQGHADRQGDAPEADDDRKSVVQGKSVDLGGRRIINKKIPTPSPPPRVLYHTTPHPSTYAHSL